MLDKALSLASNELKIEFAKILLEQAQKNREDRGRVESLDRKFYLTFYSLIGSAGSVPPEEKEQFFRSFRDVAVEAPPIPEAMQQAQRNLEREATQYIRGTQSSGGSINTPLPLLQARIRLHAEERKRYEEIQGRQDLLPSSIVTPEYLRETFQSHVVAGLTTEVRRSNWENILKDMGTSSNDNDVLNQYIRELYSALKRTFLCAKLLHQHNNPSFLQQFGTIWQCDITQSAFKFNDDLWRNIHFLIETAGNQGQDLQNPDVIRSVMAVFKIQEQIAKTHHLAENLELALKKLDKDELAKESKLSKSWFSFHAEDCKAECFTNSATREMKAQFEHLEQAFSEFNLRAQRS